MTARKETMPLKPERVIALICGDTGTGKSFFIGNLRNALIFDTDIGGGLAYLDARIARNGSERVEVGSYLDVIGELQKRRGRMANLTTLAIDHLTTLQQEAVLRYNPTFDDNTFGREHDRANKEWRKVRELVRWGDFHLFCTAHLKNQYQAKKLTGITADASKNIGADFMQVLHLAPQVSYPATAMTIKWRRDPEDTRGKVPASFPLTLDKFIEIHGCPLEGQRQELPMATAEQISQLEQFLTILKLPDGTTEKWLAKAKAESWAEFAAADLQKCIDYCQKQLPKQPAREPGDDTEAA